MNFNFINYTYDGCNIEGKCVQEPYLNSINEYITKEITDLIYYVEELRKMNYINENFDIELISAFEKFNISFNFHSKDLLQKIKNIIYEKNKIKKLYSKICKDNACSIKLLKNGKNKKITISDVAKAGEKIFLKRQKSLSPIGNTFYTLYSIFLRNIVKNLTEIYEYNEDVCEINKKILNAISKLKNYCELEKNIVENIKNLLSINYEIIEKKREIYEKEYGEIEEFDVDFSSRVNKCILISGHSLKDLDILLKSVDGLNIDVYTHDRMIFAYQHKYFNHNPNLRGQYQKGQMSFKYDFACFPGPIILANSEVNNCSGIYQGNLFTTDQLSPYGMTSIQNKDFTRVFSVANKMRGFKRNHQKKSVKIGYNKIEIKNFIEKIKYDIKNGKYNSLLIIGLFHQDAVNEDYFLDLVSKFDEKTFVLSLACDVKIPNSVHFSNYYDYSLILNILKELKEVVKDYSLSINAYIMDCSSFIMQNIMLLNYFEVKNIFIQECPELPNNPNLKKLLKDYFHTHITTFDVNEDFNTMNYG